jgi:diadenosine tetraphosphate (Ap4A) HIT family hydrolase
VLKRHCETLAELTPAELATLGPTLSLTTRALTTVLRPGKVHFGLYAEQVSHIHFHVLPRLPSLPAGNIPVTLLGIWYDLLHQLGLKRAFSDAAVAAVAANLQKEFSELGELGELRELGELNS